MPILEIVQLEPFQTYRYVPSVVMEGTESRNLLIPIVIHILYYVFVVVVIVVL